MNLFPKNKFFFSAIFILFFSFLTFSSTVNYDFVSWDDQVYVIQNSLITELSLKNIKEIFSTYVSGNYHPLTILSYAVEYDLFGLDPGCYHKTNLVLHALNSLLVFFFVYLLSKNVFISTATALLFCIHPLRIESVAWISDRKDLLYSFFFLAALIFYACFSKNRLKKYYFLAFCFFIFSLFSKATAVTLPLVFILYDFVSERKTTLFSLLEKVPFFAASAVFGVVGILARKAYQDILNEETLPFASTLILGLYRLVFYFLLRIFAPFSSLSLLLPNPVGQEALFPSLVLPVLTVLSIGFLLGLSIYSLRYTKKYFFGFLFFIITILPVLTVTMLGFSADRFTYLPSIGIMFILAQGFYPVYKKTGLRSKTLGYVFLSAGILILLFFFQFSRQACDNWKNSSSLWTYAIKEYPDSPINYVNRGVTYFRENRFDQAIVDFSKALSLDSDNYPAYRYRALSYEKLQQPLKAISDLSAAIKINPKEPVFYYKRGLLYLFLKKPDIALADLNQTLEIDPLNIPARNNRAILFAKLGKYEKAWDDIRELEKTGYRVNPKFIEALKQLSKQGP